MTKPKLNQLEMLVAVADNGGFGAAAAQLGCTQSRVSHAITELEGMLSARLLTRSRTGCIPTEAGLRVIDSARRIIRLAEGLQHDASPPNDISGHIRIACFRSVATHVLPPALQALARACPALRIDIDDSHEEREGVAVAVQKGRADIGIAQLPVPDELIAYDFVSDGYVLVVPDALHLTTPVTWSQLDTLGYLQLNCSGALTMLEQCRQAGWALQPSRTLSTDSSIVAMVRQGLGYAILPRLAVHPEPQGLRIYPLPFQAPRKFALIALPDVARTEAARLVIEHIRNRKLLENSEALKGNLIGL